MSGPLSGATQPRPNDVIDEIIDRVDNTTDRLRGRIHEINSFLDRIMGSAPEKQSPTQGGAPTAVVRNLEAALDRLNTAVNDLEMVIGRARR